jgi:hypothetical protein
LSQQAGCTVTSGSLSQEACSFTGAALDDDLTTVILDDAIADGKAGSRSLANLLGGEEEGRRCSDK